ncbi:MAG: HDOD domain-containing protein [Verrucomicrobia bacterium]|nr:HDOD domain-containing protein [Verrucomicrobiota bacterium]
MSSTLPIDLKTEAPRPDLSPVNRTLIEERVKGCARLPSLRSVESALRELLNSDRRYTQQISEIIRRDPSLTARLLRLVNSVYYSLDTPIKSIEEAVFYLGIRQIRQLAMVTPVIEDFQKLAGNTPFPWREFWQHCIGVAIMTREVISCVQAPADDSDYVAGLVHDMGRIVMAATFPDHFMEVQHRAAQGHRSLLEIETEVLGMNHTELGAMYLQHHNLPDIMIETARYHHEPERASHHLQIIAAVQIANLLVRHAEIGNSGDTSMVTSEIWTQASGWDILFPDRKASERAIACAALRRSLERLPSLLQGLV